MRQPHNAQDHAPSSLITQRWLTLLVTVTMLTVGLSPAAAALVADPAPVTDTLDATTRTTPSLATRPATDQAEPTRGNDEASAGSGFTVDRDWLAHADNPHRLARILAAHADKLPVEFNERLAYAHPDGDLRVMGTLTERSSRIDAFIEDHTEALHWYGDDARFYALATPDQVGALVASDTVTFLEPDYPLSYFLSESTADINARSVDNAGTGVWSVDRDAGDRGALVSDLDGVDDPVTGDNVTVAVIDSGIDHTHRDFGGWDCTPAPYQPCESRIKASIATDQIVTQTLVPKPGNQAPTTEAASGHGTHVAGTVAGNGFYIRDGATDTRYGGDNLVVGVAPQADLVSVKNGDTIWAGLGTAGLQWTLDHVDAYNISVTSNSWGCLSGCSYNANSATAQVVRDLYHAGVVTTFAVGNAGGSGSGAEFSGNAQNPYAIGVANYNDANQRMVSGSSRGDANNDALPDPTTWTPATEAADAPGNGYRRPDVGAPGSSIWSAATLTGGASSGTPRVTTNDLPETGVSCCVVPYRTMGGTSMATPHVSGALALLVDACQDATPLELMRAIYVGANDEKVKKTSGDRYAEAYEIGYGALDVRASLDWLATQTACITDASSTDAGSGDDSANTSASEPALTVTSPAEDATVPASTVTVNGTVDRNASTASEDEPAQGPSANLSVTPTTGEAPLEATFTLEATPGDAALETWQLIYGDGAEDNGTGAPADTRTHTYDAAGTYQATLTVTDTNGKTASANASLTVDEAAAGPDALYMVGDGSSTVATQQDQVTNYALSQDAPTGPSSDYTTAGSWNLDASENAFIPTFLSEDEITLTGDPVEVRIHVDYRQPTNLAGDICPLGAQLLTPSGTVLGPSGGTNGFVAPGLGTYQQATFTFNELPAGTYQGVQVQVGTTGVDCGNAPTTFAWGNATLNGCIAFDTTHPCGQGTGASSLTVPATSNGHEGTSLLKQGRQADTLGAPVDGVQPDTTYTVHEAVDAWSQEESPDGPRAPDYANADGIGPGSGLLIKDSPDALTGQLCTAAYLFEDPDTGQTYLSTAGHCLFSNLGDGSPIDGASPDAANTVQICFRDCVVNWAAGADTVLGLRGDYVTLDTTSTYDPVAFAQAEGVGYDFGLIPIPEDLGIMLRPWMPQWGGPTGVHQASLGLADTALHYGHGAYCCPVAGGVATRSPADQARLAQFNFNDATHFEAVAGWASGGDSGSAVSIADPARMASKGVPGDAAVGVLTHGLLPVHSGFMGTLVPQGVALAGAHDAELGNVDLVTEDAYADASNGDGGDGGDGSSDEPSNDGGVVIGELGALDVDQTDNALVLELDLAGVLDGQVPQVQGSPIEYTVDLFTDHNVAAGGSGLNYQATYSYEALQEEGAATPAGSPLVDEFRLNVLTDVGTDGLASVCPVETDLSASTYVIENSTARWVIPFSAFTHNNYPTRDDGCAAFDTTGDALAGGDTVTDITARASPKAVVLSGFPALDQTQPQDYTVAGGNTAPDASLTATPTTGVAPLDVTFDIAASDSDTGDGVQNWTLAFGDGETQAGTNTPPATLSHTYEAIGTYQAVLTVTDTNGATTSTNATIEATGPGERVDVYLDDEQTHRARVFTDTNETNPADTWSTQLDLSSVSEGEHVIRAVWVDANETVLDTANVTVTVQDPVDGAIGIDAPSEGATVPNGSTTFEGTYATQGTREDAATGWQIQAQITDEDGTPLAWTTIQHPDPDEEGAWSLDWDPDTPDSGAHTFTARLVYDGDTIQQTSVTYTVPNVAPDAQIDAPTHARAGEDVTFDARNSTDPVGDIAEYRWDFDDGTTITTTDPVLTYAYEDPGRHDVVLTVTDDDGATDQVTHPIVIQGAPPR